MLSYGPFLPELEALAERKAALGEPPPGPLQNKPEFSPVLGLIRDAWMAVYRDRQIISTGFGASLGRLHRETISQYLKDEFGDDLQPWFRSMVVRIIQRVDEVYIDFSRTGGGKNQAEDG